MKRSNKIENVTKSKNKGVWSEIEKDYDISKIAFGKKFNFIKEQFTRKVLFRDVEQAYLLSEAGFSKPAVILAGSVIEELLRQKLKHENINVSNNTFESYIEAYKNKRPSKLALHSLTNSVRHFRNLVHISKEKSIKHSISKATSKAAVSAIFTIINDF